MRAIGDRMIIQKSERNTSRVEITRSGRSRSRSANLPMQTLHATAVTDTRHDTVSPHRQHTVAIANEVDDSM